MEREEKTNVNINKIFYKCKNNKSFFYYLATFILIVGVTFFLNSNRLLNKNATIISTELNKAISINDYDVQLNSRVYNSENNLIKLHIRAKNKNLSEKNSLNFNIIERSNVNKKININKVDIDDENYILYSILPKNWSAIAVVVTEKNTNTSTKLLSDIKDIEVDKELVEEKPVVLNLEITENDIKTYKNEIAEIDKEIEDKNTSIKNLESNIIKLEEGKKYQTETENKETDASISSAKSSINQLIVDITRFNTTKIEIQEKIKKLEEKKVDLNEQMKNN